jgi:hypothetical protein
MLVVVWSPAAMLMPPLLRTVGLWAASYVLFSLFMALLWIGAVSLGRNWQNTRGLQLVYRDPPGPAGLLGSYLYLREREEFLPPVDSLAGPDD